MFIKILEPKYSVKNRSLHQLLMIICFSLIGIGFYLTLLQSMTKKSDFQIIQKLTIDSKDLHNNHCVSDVEITRK